eukprot:s2397_g16.t1
MAFAFHAYDSDEFLLSQAKNEYGLKVEYYQQHDGLEMDEFLFGAERNGFDSQYGELWKEAQIVRMQLCPQKLQLDQRSEAEKS